MKTFLMLGFLFAAQPAAVPQNVPETKAVLEPALKKALARQFPGYRLANIHDYGEAQQFPTLWPHNPQTRWSHGGLQADFDGNGLQDYTLMIRHQGRYLWIVAMDLGDAYWIRNFGEPFIEDLVEPSSYAEGKINLLLTVGPPTGLYDEIFYDYTRPGFDYAVLETFKVPLNPFPYIELSGDNGTFRTYWKDGKWRQTRTFY